MHIQEFEAIRRHGIKLLMIIANDGAYGAEIHKLRADGIDDSGAIFGRPDFKTIAEGFGLRGATVTDVSQFKGLMEEYEKGTTSIDGRGHQGRSRRAIKPLSGRGAGR